ncbi:Amino acid adenylation domain-containing protein (Fragment) OS=Streptomyces tendae OX=1932 GN=GUR47_38490 PE=4 SV=1 [Streptomyces tendae]
MAALAEVVTETGTTVTEEPGAGIGDVPLTPIKQWLLARTDDLDAFNMSAVLRVPADLDADALTEAVQALLDHHDALRARLTPAPGRRLEVREPGSVDAGALVRRVDASGADGAGLHALVREAGRGRP